VVFSSYKGASVAEFSAGELEEIFTIRAALESHATYLAAQRISQAEIEDLRIRLDQMEAAFGNQDFLQLLQIHQQFHAGIYTAAKQQRLFELAIQYFELGNVYQRMALSLGRGAKDPVVEHLEILKTLEQRESERARQLVQAHVELTISELLELFPAN
jgi:DNA-binding GntR family transcriptional regulator